MIQVIIPTKKIHYIWKLPVATYQYSNDHYTPRYKNGLSKKLHKFDDTFSTASRAIEGLYDNNLMKQAIDEKWVLVRITEDVISVDLS